MGAAWMRAKMLKLKAQRIEAGVIEGDRATYHYVQGNFRTGPVPAYDPTTVQKLTTGPREHPIGKGRRQFNVGGGVKPARAYKGDVVPIVAQGAGTLDDYFDQRFGEWRIVKPRRR